MNMVEGFQARESWKASDEIQALMSDEMSAFWVSPSAAIEVALEMPSTAAASDRAFRNLSSYLANSLKKRSAVEISERSLTEEEKEQFRKAKLVEVNNFIASKAFEALPADRRPAKSQAVHMRWILTWKLKEDGSRKAKARAVLLGYQDPLYEHRSTTSPTTTRQSRQLHLQVAASQGFRTRKGDVSGAFLQSRPYPSELFCVPCKEICEAMGLPEGSFTRVKKACYGLVDAPLEWYRSVSSFFSKIGLYKCWSDPCTWLLLKDSQMRGIVSGHVDDFLFSGSDSDPAWAAVVSAIQQEFRWGEWESDTFVQCGVKVIQHADCSFTLSQEKYVDDLSFVNLRASRKRDPKAETDGWESRS